MAVGQMLKIFLKAEALRSSLDAEEHLLAVEQHKNWKYFIETLQFKSSDDIFRS